MSDWYLRKFLSLWELAEILAESSESEDDVDAQAHRVIRAMLEYATAPGYSQDHLLELMERARKGRT